MTHGRVVSHEGLRVWQDGMSLAEDVYHLTANMPAHERFGLVRQMRRAAVSIPANIAEGAGRSSKPDFVRFLSIARGSLSELETHLLLSERLGFIVLTSEIRGRIIRLRTMLTRLMQVTQRQARAVTSSPRNPIS